MISDMIVQRDPDGFARVRVDGSVVELPAGGPYQADGNEFYVGDIWVLAGQSNMQGAGRLPNPVQPDPRVWVFDMARSWRPAVDPVHVLADSPDRVHNPGPPDPENEFAMALAAVLANFGGSVAPSFGNEFVARTGVPVGMIACAHGATSMQQWDPLLRDEGGDSLYGSMLLSVKAAGGRVAGVLWYQGESDVDGDDPLRYRGRMRDFVSAVRSDLADPGLPFYAVQLGRLVQAHEPGLALAWSTVRSAQADTEDLGLSGTAAAIDLGLDDAIHIGTASFPRLGRRLARLACGEAQTLRPAAVEADETRVVVRYEGVAGSLHPIEHISGFSIEDAAGEFVPLILRSRVEDGDTVVLDLARPVADGDRLWYGYGFDPYCNLVDDEDMAAVAFGPVPLAPSR